jgi:chorismate-pyruvate lyase
VPASPVTAELATLVGLFYQRPAELGQFIRISAEAIPEPYRQLLAHEHHMTVTVERFHHSLVNVKVLESKSDGQHYSRQILLQRQSDAQVVQFGIVRLNFEYLGPGVRQEIESQSAPLGRILINHNVLREIELMALWHVTPAANLGRLFGSRPVQTTYGRTAIIHCNGEPAVELLEIVAPA